MPNGKAYARPTIPGLGRKEFPLPEKAKTLAQMIAAKNRIVAEKLRADKPKLKSLRRFDELSEEVIRLKSGRSFKTRESAELHLRKHLIPWFNEHEPYVDQINEGTWEEYVLEQQRTRPGRKLFNDRKHLAMVMRHAYRKGIVSRPMSFRDPDPERNAGRRLSQKEIEQLLLAASPDLRLQILMAATMGMRKSEILLLSWERVDLSNETIELRAQDTKIRRARIMGMSPEVLGSLRSRSVTGPFVFSSRYNLAEPSRSNKTAWNACKRRAGVRCRFHDLRHTFLSVALLERKLNPLHVAVYAGVSLSEIQRTYLHPRVEDTRAVAWSLGEKRGRIQDAR